MYELLLRTETLFLSLRPLVLLGIGVPALIAGLVFWLGGARYSTVIVGLLGALVGAVAGLMVSQWLGLNLWLAMIVGAAVVSTVSALLRNVLVLALAVLVIAAAAGAGYLAVALDKAIPQEQTEPDAQASTGQSLLFQSLSGSDARLDYVDRMTRQEADFAEKVRAIGTDTWETAQPHIWKLALSVAAGAAVAVFLVWFVKKALIALAYSVVGTATLIVGAQTTTLAGGWHVVSAIRPGPWALPATFGGMVAFGWVVQLIISRTPKPQKAEKHPESSE